VTVEHWFSAFTLGTYPSEVEARTSADRYPTRNGEWVRMERIEE
jgi:hypothetical protein